MVLMKLLLIVVCCTGQGHGTSYGPGESLCLFPKERVGDGSVVELWPQVTRVLTGYGFAEVIIMGICATDCSLALIFLSGEAQERNLRCY